MKLFEYGGYRILGEAHTLNDQDTISHSFLIPGASTTLPRMSPESDKVWRSHTPFTVLAYALGGQDYQGQF